MCRAYQRSLRMCDGREASTTSAIKHNEHSSWCGDYIETFDSKFIGCIHALVVIFSEAGFLGFYGICAIARKTPQF